MSKRKIASSQVKIAPAADKKEVVSKVVKTKKAVLTDAPQENYFVLCNGQQVKNVKELADALEFLGDDVFGHHVNSDRNDFSNWIHDVFKDEELALNLAGIKDKKDTRIVMYKHIIKCLDK
jgi:hypothetical protein